jgi:hypothetical protein
MVKVFYVGGSASGNGMLRAIIAEWQVADLLASQDFTYLGSEFPMQATDDPSSAILEVSAEQGEGTWQPGFYRAAHPPIEFDETLRSLDQRAKIPVTA